MTNKQKRKVIIFFDYSAPDAKRDADNEIIKPPEKKETDPKKKKKQDQHEPTAPIEFTHNYVFETRNVEKLVKDKGGNIPIKKKGTIRWTANGDLKPQNGEHILKFYNAELSYNAVGDPDRFTLLNISKDQKQIITDADKPYAGKISSGNSVGGYSVTVESYTNLTELPDNSDWSYTIKMDVQAQVPYTHDLSGKKYPKKGGKKEKDDSDDTVMWRICRIRMKQTSQKNR